MTRNQQTIIIGIAQLIHPEHCGDWHDKPVRYLVAVDSFPALTQKFSTIKDAKTWASCVRRSGGDYTTASDLWRSTFR